MSIQLPDRADTAIIGAGLAGLSCARRLVAAGQTVAVIEASDGAGGRVRTDVVDGFRLDRGFQVLLMAYPEVQRSLSVPALDMQMFDPGAVVWSGGQGFPIGDPFRDPSVLIETVKSPVLPLADKLRILRLRWKVGRGEARRLFGKPEQTTSDRLQSLGFSDEAVTQFLGPLFAGIQLDPDLQTSSRMFDTIFRCLSQGDSGVPSLGMGQISDQLAAGLPENAVILNERAIAATATEVTTASGRVVAENVVVATEGPAAAQLLDIADPGSHSVSCVWFSADMPPTTSRAIVLDGRNEGPARNVAVMSNVASAYAPAGRHLIAAACPGTIADDLETSVTAQLTAWFGPQVADWTCLRVDRIAHGQPIQTPPLRPRQSVRRPDGRWVCGDHRDTGSIQGAMFSGRRTAEAILGLPRSVAEVGL